MPILADISQAGPPASSGTATWYQEVLLNAGGAFNSQALMVPALPALTFWAEVFNAGGVAVTLQPQFAARGTTNVVLGQPNPVPTWLDLAPPVLIPAFGGGVTLNNYICPCVWIRMVLTRTAAVNTSVRLYMAGSV